MSIDCDLWDLVEDGVNFENMDLEGVVSSQNRKSFTPTQKLEYKKHHSVKGMMTNAISHDEYLKIGDKRTAKSIWDSLKSKYEGNKQVKEAKANLLVHQYELFKMKDGEDIETMFSRFQILVSGLQVLDKSYIERNSSITIRQHHHLKLWAMHTSKNPNPYCEQNPHQTTAKPAVKPPPKPPLRSRTTTTTDSEGQKRKRSRS
jgi:hypothetical protein